MDIILVLILSVVAYFISTDIYTPSMPMIAHHFGVHKDVAQKSLTYFLAGAILSCLFSGIIADHYGKRKILLSALLIAIAGSLLAAFCASIHQLLFARLLQGIGGATINVVAIAMIHDYTPENKTTKVFGTLGIYFAVIPALAPVLGGYISGYLGWRSNFYILVILYISSYISILTIVPKDKLNEKKKQNLFQFSDYRNMLTTRTFMFILLISPIFVSAEWFLISYLPFYIQKQFQYSPESYGLFLSSLLPWYACGSYLAGKYGQKIGLSTLIYIAIGLAGLASLILLITAMSNYHSIIPIYISLIIYFWGFGLLFPATSTKVFAYFPNLKATTSALRAILVTSFALLGTLFADMANETQLIHLVFYFCSITILTFLLFRFRGKNVP